MNSLKAEMERKKRQLAEKQLVGPDKKYFKRGDLMEKEREEYLQRNRPKDEDIKKLHESVQTKEKSTDKCKLSELLLGLCYKRVQWVQLHPSIFEEDLSCAHQFENFS